MQDSKMSSINDKKLLKIYSYISQHFTLESEEKETFYEVLKQYFNLYSNRLIATGNNEEAARFLTRLLTTNFDLTRIEPYIYQALLDGG